MENKFCPSLIVSKFSYHDTKKAYSIDENFDFQEEGASHEQPTKH